MGALSRRCDAGTMLMVASVSDAQLATPPRGAGVLASANASSPSPGTSGSQAWFAQRPSSSFLVHRGSTPLLSPSTMGGPTMGAASRSGERAASGMGASCSPHSSGLTGISAEDFRVRSTRRPLLAHFPMPRVDALSDLVDEDELVFQANNLRRTVMTKLQQLLGVQRQAFHQVERAGRWLNARRQRFMGDGSNSVRGHQHNTTHGALREDQRLVMEALQAEREADPERAMRLFEQLVQVAPSAEAYARLSKQYTDMTFLPNVPADKVVEWNTTAVELAERAKRADPQLSLGHVALCVSRGRLALVSDTRTKVQLAKEAADDAAEALRLDPHSDLAHHLMGRWHYEMAQLGPIARYIIKLLFGTALMQGTFPEALEHFETAQRLCPERVIHRVEVGRSLMKLGHPQAAAQALQTAMDMDIEDINAKLQQEDAAGMLKQIERSGKLGLLLGQPATGNAQAPGSGSASK